MRAAAALFAALLVGAEGFIYALNYNLAGSQSAMSLTEVR
jgi:hypothetical protein